MKLKMLKQTKKLGAVFGSAVLVAAMCAGCGNANNDAANDGKQETELSAAEETGEADTENTENTAPESTGNAELVLKLGHGLPAAGMAGKAYEKYAEYVKELSNGTIEIELYPGGTLVSDTDCFDSVMSGTIDLTHDAVNRQSGTIPDLALLEIPGYYTGDAQEWLEFAEDLREPLDSIYQEYGVKYIAGNYQGTSVLVSNGKQLKEPSDLEGLSVRAIGTSLSNAVQNWGGAPVSLGLADLPNGLERGTVDAAYTAWSVAIPNSLYEVSDYMTYTNICETYASLMMNLNKWNSLDEEQQDILIEAGKKFEEYCVELAMEAEAAGKTTASEAGCEVYELTEEETAAFVDGTESLFEECEGTLSENGKALLDVIRSYKK